MCISIYFTFYKKIIYIYKNLQSKLNSQDKIHYGSSECTRYLYGTVKPKVVYQTHRTLTETTIFYCMLHHRNIAVENTVIVYIATVNALYFIMF